MPLRSRKFYTSSNHKSRINKSLDDLIQVSNLKNVPLEINGRKSGFVVCLVQELSDQNEEEGKKPTQGGGFYRKQIAFDG